MTHKARNPKIFTSAWWHVRGPGGQGWCRGYHLLPYQHLCQDWCLRPVTVAPGWTWRNSEPGAPGLPLPTLTPQVWPTSLVGAWKSQSLVEVPRVGAEQTERCDLGRRALAPAEKTKARPG